MRNKIVIGKKVLDFNSTTYVMGILNVTPDSFSDGGKHESLEKAIKKAKEMVEAGATIIDIGGESTRPGAEYVDLETEISRVAPVIKRLSEEVEVLISIDTYKAEVAKKAVEAGAHIINDVTGFKGDNNMATVAAKLDVPCILMHMRGTPKTMQKNPKYDNLLVEIKSELNESVKLALDAGVKKENIILDPGIGFAKRFEDNLELIKATDILLEEGYPLLVGASRKRFIGDILEADVDSRLEGSLAVAVISASKGAGILRVHDVEETVKALRVTDAIIKG